MTVKNVEKLEKSRVAVTVEVGAEEFEAAVAKAYAKARGKLSIPGFRPGKAPRKMIEKLYGAGVFYSDAVDIALPEAYTQAIGQSGLDVVGYPEIEIVDFDFYDTAAFNQCENAGCALMAVENWRYVHPLLKILPVNWDYTIPFGILHAPEPTPVVQQFLQAVQQVLKN